MNEDTTLSRPLRRRDLLIAVALVCAAIAVAMWRSDFGHFPDTVGRTAEPSRAGAAGSPTIEVAPRPPSE